MALKDLIKRQGELRTKGNALNDVIRTKEAAGDDATSEKAEFEAVVTDLERATSEVKRLGKLGADAPDEAPEADEDDGEKNFAPRYTKRINLNTKYASFVEPKQAGEMLGRKAIADFMVKELGTRRDAAEWVMKHFRDQTMAEIVAKGIIIKTAPMDTTTPVIPQGWSKETIDLLYASSNLLPLLRREPMPLGQTTIYRQRLGGTVTYMNELANAGVTQIGFDHIELRWRKYGGVHSCSKELAMFAPLDIAGKMVNDLAKKSALFMESEVMLGSGSSGTVTGIVNSMATGNKLTSTTVSGNPTFQTVAYDLENLKLVQVQNLVNPDSIVYIMPYGVGSFLRQIRSPYGGFPVFQDFATNKTIDGRPTIETSLLASNMGNTVNQAPVLALSTAHAILGEAGQFNIATTDTGSYLDGSTQVNTFGQDVLAFRATGYFDFAMEHDVAASELTTTAWSLSNLAAQDSYTAQAANTGHSSASGA